MIERLRGLSVAADSTLDPVKGAPGPYPLHHEHSKPESNTEGQSEADAIIWRDDVERWIFRGRPGAVDKSWIIEGGVDVRRIDGLDRDPLPFFGHPLLRIRPKISRRRSLVT